MSSKKILLLILFVGIFLVGAVGSYSAFKLSEVFVKKETPKGTISPTASPTPAFDSLSPYNVLILGYGGEGHEGGNLTDTMIVANVDHKKQKVTLISVPRDLWIPLPTDGDKMVSSKINAAYAIGGDDAKYPGKRTEFKGEAGGGELAKYAAGVATGMPISYFISVDFDGFRSGIDLLGGIEVDVPKTFDDFFYPVKGKENESCGKSAVEIQALSATMSGFLLEKEFACRYEHIHFDKGKNTMNGETALKFVRSRHSDEYGGDFARSERQSAVLVGVKDKIISLGIIPKAGPLFDKLVSSVRTDMGPGVIKEVLSNLGDSKKYTLSSIHLTEDNVFKTTTGPGGAYILIPKEGENKWAAVHKFVSEGINSAP